MQIITNEKIKLAFIKFLNTNNKFLQVVKEYKDRPKVIKRIISELFDEFQEELNPWKYKPVTPKEFIEDGYYGGINPLTGVGICETMHPKLKEDFCNVHDFNSGITEVIATGGIGVGKTYFMSLGEVWHIYLLSCFKNPAKYFGLSLGSKIAIMVLSITERQSKKNMFFNIKSMINKIQYFKDKFMFDEKRATDSLIFPNDIEVFNGTSSQSSTLSLNIYSAALDEANFFKVIDKSKRSKDADGEYDEALTLYNTLLRRQDSRFLKKGVEPGILYVGSSRVYPNDFTEQRINDAKQAELVTGKKRTYIIDYNLWTVNREKYGKEEFKVEVGGLNRRSRILNGDENDITGQVINVPMEFYDKFIKDIDNSIRDIAGVAVYSVQPFFGQREYVQKMFDPSMERIFSVDSATLSDKQEYKLIEKIVKHKIKLPERPRYVGLDLGVKHDKFGFAMGYIEEIEVKKNKFFNESTQNDEEVTLRLPKINIEMVLEIYPEREFGEVEFSRVRFLVFQLRKIGYKIKFSSADGFQSVDMQQIFKRAGIQTDYISMDKTLEPYETFRGAVYDERVKCIYHKKLEEEMVTLEKNYVLNKVDHVIKGSKDLCDAVGQVVYNCHKNMSFFDDSLLPHTLGVMEDKKEESYESIIEDFDNWVKFGNIVKQEKCL